MADVLREFFELRDDGWHQKRADEEIARYRAKMPDLEAKKENDRERQRRARDRRKQLFESLRDHGIVPPWDATTAQLQDALSRATTDTGDAAVTPPVTEPVTRDNTATHSPYTKHQTPNTKGKEEREVRSPSGSRIPDGFPGEAELAHCRQVRPDLPAETVAQVFRDFWLAKPGKDGRKLDWPATWRVWVSRERGYPQTAGGASPGRRRETTEEHNRRAMEQFLGETIDDGRTIDA